jgi:hypothetical protein
MTHIGWLKDKYDSRDYPYKPYRFGAAQVPDVVDLSALLASRLDQDGMNGCVGAALRTAICATLKSQSAFQEDQSWIWPWKGARYKEGTLSQNVGVQPRDAFDWLVEQGCLPNQDLPFSGQFDASAPSSLQMAEAVKYPGFNYYRVGDGAAGIMESLAESLASLQSGGPAWLVCLGSPWPDKWDSAPDGILANITQDDSMPNGHEYIVHGYDRPNGRLMMANSWGLGWAKNGLASMPMSALDVFKAKGGYDAQYLSFKATPAPNPAPVNNPGCNPLSVFLKLFKTNSTQFCFGG